MGRFNNVLSTLTSVLNFNDSESLSHHLHDLASRDIDITTTDSKCSFDLYRLLISLEGTLGATVPYALCFVTCQVTSTSKYSIVLFQ